MSESKTTDRTIQWDERCVRIAKAVTHPSYGGDRRCKILDHIQIGLDAAREEGYKKGYAEGYEKGSCRGSGPDDLMG